MYVVLSHTYGYFHSLRTVYACLSFFFLSQSLVYIARHSGFTFALVVFAFLVRSIFSGVATNSAFCERIVLRIPEPRSNDYSSILNSIYTYWRYIPKPPNGFACLFLTETMHNILNNMWQSYMTSTWLRNFINCILANFPRNFRTFC